MAKDILSLQEASAELGLPEETVLQAVQSGKLKSVSEEDPTRFDRQEVDRFKQQVQSDTMSFEQVSDQDGSHVDLGTPGDDQDTSDDPNEITEFSMETGDDDATASRIDLAEVESEAGADESDQTSVLPIGEEATSEEGDQQDAVFDFAEDELGLAEEDTSDAVEAKSDEGDSSADILELSEELDEESSSDAMVAITDDSEEEKPAVGDADVVADMLEAGVEEGDDELDTIDLDDIEGPAGGADDLMSVMEDETSGSSADTSSLTAEDAAAADEADTASLDAQDVETEGVDAEDQALGFEEEAEEAAPAYAYGGAAGAMAVRPAVWANAMLVVSVVLVAFGGFIMLCEAAGATANPVIDFVRNFINERF